MMPFSYGQIQYVPVYQERVFPNDCPPYTPPEMMIDLLQSLIRRIPDIPYTSVVRHINLKPGPEIGFACQVSDPSFVTYVLHGDYILPMWTPKPMVIFHELVKFLIATTKIWLDNLDNLHRRNPGLPKMVLNPEMLLCFHKFELDAATYQYVAAAFPHMEIWLHSLGRVELWTLRNSEWSRDPYVCELAEKQKEWYGSEEFTNWARHGRGSQGVYTGGTYEV